MMAAPSKQSGLGMIEVLVAVVILAVGLLGLAAMQVTASQTTTQSAQKTQALLLAEDMIERVRANRSAAGSYDDVSVGSEDSCSLDYAPTAADVATNDINGWRNSVRCLLADGSGQVEVDTGASTVEVTLSWESRKDSDDADAIAGEDTVTLATSY
ncbi:type IV pilus modification protein PilV [Vreelandella utahensis]|uniref:type IV pilus modification protein PilV n=1 Tax=Vreelandella halophila TaxID=86177 RepID=UPI000984BB86